jgi:molybdenum cofactor cytidylyltransferase
MITGLVLAGGASRRLGQPKALLRLDGESFVARLYRLFSALCGEVWIVTGAHDAEIRQGEPSLAGRMLFNAGHEEGQLSSLQCGLAAVGADSSVLFSPVDYAAVSLSTIASLLAAEPADVVKPRYEGQSGHPVLVSRAAAGALRAAGGQDNAKAILRRFAGRYVDCQDRHCASDVDTMDDYQQLLAAWSQPQ